MSSRYRAAASCGLPRNRDKGDRPPVRGGLLALLLVAGLAGTAWARTPEEARGGRRGLDAPSHRFRAPAEAPRGETLPDEIGIGMVVTPGDAHRKSRLQGASLAIVEATRRGGWQGVPFALRVGKAGGPWGTAAEAARDLLFQGDCVALITPPDRAVSHLLEQVAARGHVPLVSLSSDSSLTRVPVPWLVRIVPDHRAEMRALIRSLPERPVGPIPALIPAGREGRPIRGDLVATERRLRVTFDPVIEFEESGPADRLASLQEMRSGPLLVWLSGPTAGEALGLAALLEWRGPVLLPRTCFEGGGSLADPLRGLRPMAVRLFGPAEEGGAGAKFAGRYRESFGTDPDEAAASAYDAASLLVEAVRRVGPGRSAIRDWLVRPKEHFGVTGRIRFDGMGNREGVLPVQEGGPKRLGFMDPQGGAGLFIDLADRPRGEEKSREFPERADTSEERPSGENRRSDVSLRGKRDKGR